MVSREMFTWTGVSPLDESALDESTVAALAELGFRPKFTYVTKTEAGIANYHVPLSPLTRRWEYWCSDDDVTWATLELAGDTPVLNSYQTAFDGASVPGAIGTAEILTHRHERQVELDAEIELPTFVDDDRYDSPYLDLQRMDVDSVQLYEAHRDEVAKRVASGGTTISMHNRDDREAWWKYYGEHLSSPNHASLISAYKEMGQQSAASGTDWFGALIIAIPAVLIIAIIAFLWNLSDLLDWLIVWWPIVAVAIAPKVLVQYAGYFFHGHMNHLDHKYPDSMKEHAGYWTKQQIAKLRLKDVEVGKAREPFLSGLDAYLPFRDKIVLGEKTYDKQDPTFWAIGAHELGHAIDFRRRRFLRPLSIGGRLGQQQLMSWLYAGLLTNTFFGWAAANIVLNWIAIAAAVCGAIVLIDEALASIIAMRLLRTDERLDEATLGDLARHLFLAFGTYASVWLAVVATVVGWEHIATYIEANANFVPAEPLHPGRTTLGNLLSVFVMILCAMSIVRSAKARQAKDKEPEQKRPMFCHQCKKRFPEGTTECPNDATPLVNLPEVEVNKVGCGLVAVGLLSCFGFVLEVWDQPLGPEFRAAVFVFAPLVLLLAVPYVLPVNLLFALPLIVLKRLKIMPDPPKETPGERARAAAADVAQKFDVLDPRRPTPWYVTAASPSLWMYATPLVILWWMAQL